MLAESVYILSLLSLILLANIFAKSSFMLLILIILLIPIIATLISLKTAPFVPTSAKKINTMMDFADIKAKDRVYDLGAGDGRIVKKAANLGANAAGYEISFPLVVYFYINKYLRGGKGALYWANFWKKDFSDANTIITFLMDKPMARFKKEIYPNLKPGTKIISNTFEIPGLEPQKSENGVYLYIKN